MHRLRILPVYFEAIKQGYKTFEVRDNRDRDFQRGDEVLLEEFDPNMHGRASGDYTGRTITRSITHVSTYEQKAGFVVFLDVFLSARPGLVR